MRTLKDDYIAARNVLNNLLGWKVVVDGLHVTVCPHIISYTRQYRQNTRVAYMKKITTAYDAQTRNNVKNW